MKTTVKWVLAAALLSTGLTSCSSGGEEEQGEEINASEEGEEGAEGDANAAVEGEGNENVAMEGGENANAAVEGENANGNLAANAEGGNIAAEGGENNFTNSEIPPELLNSETATANAGAENATAGAEGTNIPAEANAAAATNVADAGVGNAAVGNAAAPAPEAVPAPAPSGDMRVYYVMNDGGQIRNAPNASGQSVGSVSKGDPLLVKIEGEWASVAGRGFIEVAALSQTPVGRTSSPKAWK